MKDNVTGKDKEFYERGKRMFDRLNPLGNPPPQRQPLSYHKIAQILDHERMKWNKSPPTYEFDFAFARAIEAAHGIKETKE